MGGMPTSLEEMVFGWQLERKPACGKELGFLLTSLSPAKADVPGGQPGSRNGIPSALLVTQDTD